MAGRRDHRRVVGAQAARGHVEDPPALSALALESLPQRGVGGHAAGEHDASDPGAARRLRGLAHQHLDRGGLEGRGHVGHLRGTERTGATHVQRDRGLDAAEGESGRPVAHVGGREGDGAGIAGARDPLDGGAAREAEAEQLGHLVEGLARRVVAGLPDALVTARLARQVERGVPARDHQGEKRVGGGLTLQEGGVDVTLEVVDGHQGPPARVGDRLGRRAADEERADEPGPVGHREAVHVVEPHPGRLQRAPHHRHQHLQVPPRGQLGHHAAVGCVHVVLRGDDAGEHLPASVHHRSGGLVTRGLDAEDDHRVAPSARESTRGRAAARAPPTAARILSRASPSMDVRGPPR